MFLLFDLLSPIFYFSSPIFYFSSPIFYFSSPLLKREKNKHTHTHTYSTTHTFTHTHTHTFQAATEQMHESKRQVNSITADVKDMTKRINKFEDRVSDLIDESEKKLSETQALVTKMQYRADIAFSCALTGMVTAFALHLEDLVKAGNKVGLENLLYLDFWFNRKVFSVRTARKTVCWKISTQHR